MQPPRGGHRQPGDVGHNRAETAMPQSFLHADQNRFVVSGLDMDDAIRRQTGLFQSRCEQILLRHAP